MLLAVPRPISLWELKTLALYISDKRHSSWFAWFHRSTHGNGSNDYFYFRIQQISASLKHQLWKPERSIGHMSSLTPPILNFTNFVAHWLGWFKIEIISAVLIGTTLILQNLNWTIALLCPWLQRTPCWTYCGQIWTPLKFTLCGTWWSSLGCSSPWTRISIFWAPNILACLAFSLLHWASISLALYSELPPRSTWRASASLYTASISFTIHSEHQPALYLRSMSSFSLY